MSDVDLQALEDPWLTVAEISSELRISPATVRLWVSKGTLPAMRAGQRKLLIRRSDLDRMLEGWQPRASQPVDPSRFLQRVESLLDEDELTQDALLAHLDVVLAHIREALLVYWGGRRAISARERRDP